MCWQASSLPLPLPPQVLVEKEVVVVVVVAQCAVQETSSDFTLKKFLKLFITGLYQPLSAITRLQALAAAVVVVVVVVVAAAAAAVVDHNCLIKVIRKIHQGPILVPQGLGLGPCLVFYPQLNGFLVTPRKHPSKSLCAAVPMGPGNIIKLLWVSKILN